MLERFRLWLAGIIAPGDFTPDPWEWNTMLQVVCRVHPEGADGFYAFQQWWSKPENQAGWLSAPRACGWWLRSELEKNGSDA